MFKRMFLAKNIGLVASRNKQQSRMKSIRSKHFESWLKTEGGTTPPLAT
jgi:hypothetical protein